MEKKRSEAASTDQRKKPKPGRLFRKKPLRSVGTFMNKILKSFGTLGQFGSAPGDVEDDDGGFRNGTQCTLNVCKTTSLLQESHSTARGSLCTGRDKLWSQYGDRTPGALGLKNHGNTCFMNAVVQCLSNTDLLAEYLGLEKYKLDVKGEVKGEGGKGVKGEVTGQLAALVRALWTLEYKPQMSVEFKTAVSSYGAQFRGNAQHDALEFLLWLLDRVHEDVTHTHNNNNQISEGDSDHRPVHTTKAQSSFVHEHFQAQYKSSLTCPHCLKQSHTFDPFLCISLPIPQRQTRSLSLVLVFSSKGQRYLRVALSVPLYGSVGCLRRLAAEQGGLSPDQVILTEVYSSGFQRSFFDEDDVSSITENDVIYAFQAPPLYIRAGSTRLSGCHHSLPSSPLAVAVVGGRMTASGAVSTEFLPQSVTHKVLLLVCNASGTGQQVVRFGPPFVMREDRGVSWEQLQQSILSKLYYLMVNGAQPQNGRVLFNIRVEGGSAFYSYLSPQDGRPLCHPAVERALTLCGSGGPPHVKLVVEWEPRLKDCLFGNIHEEVVKEADSVRDQEQQEHSATLDQCFQLYTKEEQLAPDDAWKCPHCLQLQQGTVQMSLWTLPDILILHLKRFRQVGERRNKLSALVHFPLSGLDMSPHMVPKRQPPTKHPTKHPAKPPGRRAPGSTPAESLYDLYAVCNHHGGMSGGHYTAFCRNSVDGQWYSFDDSSVEVVPEAEVVTHGAYLLFYQRRDSIPLWSAGSSASGSTSSSASDHWLVRLTGGSSEQDSGPPGSTTPESLELPVFGDETPKSEDANGFDTKPFVRGTQGRSVSMCSPSKSKDPLSRVLPLRWSLTSKESQPKTPPPPPRPGELVEYLESGRRPRCTKEPIVSLVATPPLRTPRGRMLHSGQDSPSGGIASAGLDSPKIAEGQRRVCVENSSRSSKRTLDYGLPKGVMQEVAFSQSAPASRDSTLRRNRIQNGGSTRTQKDLLHMVLDPEDRSGFSVHDRNSHESLLSFFKPGFIKKDSPRSPFQSRLNGKPASTDLSKLSYSNGTLHATDPRLSGVGRMALEYGDLGHAHSSSNVMSGYGRCASLQRSGGPVGGAPAQRSVLTDKPGYSTLQWTRYNSTSLVPT